MKIRIALKSMTNRVYLTVAVALSLFLAMAGTARAVSVTNVIYYDTFNRTGQLVGTAPDTVNAPGAVWVGGYPTNGLVTDGTEASITNALGIVPPYENAFLPLNVETGHVYVVTCTVVGNTNASGLLAFGYSNIPGLGTGPENNANWGLDWVAVNSSNNGCSYWEYGGIRSFQTNYAFTPSMTYSTVLAVTNTPTGGATNLIGSFFINGAFVTTLPAVPATRVTEDSGTCVGFVFLGHSTTLAAGSFQNLSVTDIVLNATTPTILEQPNNLTAQVGHTATFWVRGYALPDPTYQWMTNGTPIPGATNASYTTPALSTAYNGMQYSAQLSTAAGSVTSSSGTLTVTAGTPTVYSATKTASPNNVVVNFSGPVDPTTGLNPANYAFLVNGASAGVSVTGVSYGSSSNNVILQTSALNPNTGYYLAVQGVQDQFGEVMNTSTNPVLPAGLVFYFRGDSGVQLDGNGKVAQWLDQTTNGNNASQFFGMYPNISSEFIPSTLARPAVGTIGANNMPAISFNPVNTNFMTVAPSEQMNLNGDLTMYCYANPSNTSAQEVFGEDNGNMANAFELQLDATSLSPRLLFGDGNNSGSSTFDGAGPALAVAPHVWTITSQIVGTNNVGAPTPLTNSISWWVDGAPFGNGGLGHNLATANYPGAEYTGRPIYIGGRMDHGAWMNGTIGELMLFGAPLSAPDRTNVDNYLGQKYFSFSFATNLPATLTTSNGFQATYTIYPSQGSLHFVYQWQENGTNIPGANSQSYTTPVLEPANSNTTYDVEVTLPNGTTYTSSTNTLIVIPAAPYVTSAGIPLWEATGSTNIVVLFDVAVNPATAAVAGNYSVSGASVSSAVMGLEPNKVILTTTPLAAWNANPGNYSVTVQNVQDLAGDTIVPVSSSVGIYPAATALWLEGNAGVTLDSGNSSYAGVYQWNDQSGNAADLGQQGGPTLDPLYTTNYHGNAAIQFSGTNTTSIGGKGYGTYLYSNPNGSTPDYPCLEIANDLSIFAVATFNTLAGGTNGDIVSKTGFPSTNRPAPYDFYVNATPATVWYRGNGGANIANTISTAGPSVGVPHIISGMQAGSTVSQFLDTAPAGTSTISIPEPYVDLGQVLTVGMRNDLTGNRLNGQLFELIMIASALDTNDLASIHSYLASKYTIPTGANAYPAITQQPVARTNAYATTTVTVPAGVSLGNPAATIQWYDTNGVAIAGQTSATLVIPNIQANDTYYLVASNYYGSVISSPVAVNVLQVSLNPTNIVFSVITNQMTLSWPVDHIGWQLQAETNSLSVGLNNKWVNVSGSTTTNQIVVPINVTNGTVFYRLMLVP